MGEIKREPIRIVDGEAEYDAFDEDHTFADIARYVYKQGGAEEVIYFLQEMINNGAA